MPMRIAHPSVTRDCAERLLEMARTGQGDPLGYEASGGEMTQADCDVDNVNRMDELATAALRGDRDLLLRLSDWPTLRRIDSATRALIAHMGVDPDAVRTLSDVLGKTGMDLDVVDAEGEDDQRPVISSTPLAWAVHLKRGEVAWNSVGFVVTPVLPDVVAATAVGRRLSDVFSHSVLDAHDLYVTEITSGARTSTIAVDAAEEST